MHADLALLNGKIITMDPHGSIVDAMATKYNRVIKVSTEHPVIFEHFTGHFNGVNSYIFEKAGITEDTPDPPCGKIERDEKGIPSGVIHEKSTSLL